MERGLNIVAVRPAREGSIIAVFVRDTTSPVGDGGLLETKNMYWTKLKRMYRTTVYKTHRLPTSYPLARKKSPTGLAGLLTAKGML